MAKKEVGLQTFTLGALAPVIEMRELAGHALPTPIAVRELLWGDRAVLVEMSVPAGFAAPLHAHEHESLIYVLSGRMRATVDDETRELGPGDAVLHAVGARHLIEAIVDTRWIEIKAPPTATWPAVGPDRSKRQVASRLAARALGCRVPVVQASIGRVGDAALAVAVSKAGGLGSLGASYMALGALREQVREMRRLTEAPLAVNLILAFDQIERLEVAVEENAPWISFSWGIDATLIARAHAGGTQVLVQVASVEEARSAAAANADALIVQGSEAGGHVQSLRPLLPLLREVRAAISLPLVAAGGIGDPKAARAAAAAGADAVSMGTRFAASSESLAHPRYRERLTAAKGTDTVLTGLFDVGWMAPHRVLRNKVYDVWEAAGSPPSGQRPGEGELVAEGPSGAVVRYAVSPAVIGMTGDIDAMAMYAGLGVGEIRSVEPAADLVERFARALV